MQRRSRLEILLDVLDTINRKPMRPTRVMYRCNLSWKIVNEVLDIAVSQELVSKEKAGNGFKYAITDKGRKVLEYSKFIRANTSLVVSS